MTTTAATCPTAVVDVPLELPSGRRAGAGTAGLGAVDLSRSSELLARMRVGEVGSVHSWELVTAVDGPGTRLTVFMNGCPLRCLYCHNPDTWKMRDGKAVEFEALMARIARYRGVFSATGGGITMSGGEPLQQPAFVARVLAAAKEMGIHTAIDTSGFLGASCTDEMLDNIDLVLLDVKSGDPETYRKVTGRRLQPTLDFGRRLSERGVETWIRFVLVPGLTDGVENVEKVASYVEGLSCVSRVEVLPFHQMGTDKWKSLGLEYQLEDTRAPEPELVERVRGQFRAHGLTVY
jgi:pyruvate formate lyase activating enzyme